MTQLQTALDQADRERVLLRSQLDQAEEKIDSLANLYLAAYTLHRRHEWSTVMRGLTDVLVNQIGADSFAVYLGTVDGRIDVILSQLLPDGAPAGEELAASLTRNEITYDAEGLVADIPLVNADQVVGFIHIYRMLSQKRSLNDEDKKLLTAVSFLAATAIIASSGARPGVIEPGKVEPVSVAGSADTIKPPTTAKIAENAVAPPAADVFKMDIRVGGDVGHDLSEMSPVPFDYSALLNAHSDAYNETDPALKVSGLNAVRNGTEDGPSDNLSSRVRTLSVNSSGPSTHKPGEDYLKFVGSGMTAPGDPGESQQEEQIDKLSDKDKGSGHRESGLLFRQSPIKRA